MRIETTNRDSFRAAVGAQFPTDLAQVAGPWLERLSVRGAGLADTDEIVAEAAKPQAPKPVHDYFEWRDEVCGLQHRRGQARHLANHIEINVHGSWVRGFVNVDARRIPRALVDVSGDAMQAADFAVEALVQAQRATDFEEARGYTTVVAANRVPGLLDEQEKRIKTALAGLLPLMGRVERLRPLKEMIEAELARLSAEREGALAVAA